MTEARRKQRAKLTTRFIDSALDKVVDNAEKTPQNACGNNATLGESGSMYQIKKGVPIPGLRRREGKTYPFAQMERADCFEVPTNGSNAKTTRASVYAAVRKYQMKNPTKQFTTRIIDDKLVGVWRIK